jgi:hypothetical protein
VTFWVERVEISMGGWIEGHGEEVEEKKLD